MTKFYFTFGVQSAFAKKFVEIIVEAPDPYMEARNQMEELFQQKWAFQYTKKDFAHQPNQYELTKLATIAKNEFGFYRAVDEM